MSKFILWFSFSAAIFLLSCNSDKNGQARMDQAAKSTTGSTHSNPLIAYENKKQIISSDTALTRPGIQNEVVLSIIFNQHNFKTGIDSYFVMPTVRIANGHYDALPDHLDDSMNAENLSSTLLFLKAYPLTYVYKRGKIQGRLENRQIFLYPDISCISPPIAVATGKIRDSLYNDAPSTVFAEDLSHPSKQLLKNPRPQEKKKTVILLGLNRKIESNFQINYPQLPVSQIKILKEILADSINHIRKNNIIIADSLHILKLFATDFDSDGHLEYVCFIENQDSIEKELGDTLFRPSIFAFHLNGDKIIPFYLNTYHMQDDSWSDGYIFLDLLDLNGDRVPELIMEVDVYEGVNYQIFEFRNGTFKSVFEGGGYGC